MATRTIKIKYLKAHDYKTSLATGSMVGMTANGLINISFFTERMIFPDAQIIEIDDSGKTTGTPIDHKDGDLIREVQFGAIMDIKAAKSIIGVLQKKIEEFEQRNKL